MSYALAPLWLDACACPPAHPPPPGYTASGNPCSAGQHLDAVGSTASCDNCVAGTYSAEGNNVCRPCPTGSYAPNPSMATCGSCTTAQLPGMAVCPTASCANQWYQVKLTSSLATTTSITYSPPEWLSDDLNSTAGVDACTRTSNAMLAINVNTDCSVTMFSLDDYICSNPSIDYWTRVQLPGYLYDDSTLQSALPSTFTEDTDHTQCVPLPACQPAS